MPRKDFKSVSDILNNDSAFSGFRKVAKENDVLEEYYNIFPDLKNVSEPVKVSKGILFLRIENSVWKSELNLRRNIIIERINKHFESEVISSIRFL